VLREEGDVLVYDITEALPVFGHIVNVRSPHPRAVVLVRLTRMFTVVCGRRTQNTVQVTRSFQVGKGYHHIDSEVKAYGLAQHLFSAKHRFTLQVSPPHYTQHATHTRHTHDTHTTHTRHIRHTHTTHTTSTDGIVCRAMIRTKRRCSSRIRCG
jgi:hypothetical protein